MAGIIYSSGYSETPSQLTCPRSITQLLEDPRISIRRDIPEGCSPGVSWKTSLHKKFQNIMVKIDTNRARNISVYVLEHGGTGTAVYL